MLSSMHLSSTFKNDARTLLKHSWTDDGQVFCKAAIIVTFAWYGTLPGNSLVTDLNERHITEMPWKDKFRHTS